MNLEKCYQCSVNIEISLDLKVYFSLVMCEINNLIALRLTNQITEISASWWLSEKSFFLKKKSEIWTKYGQWCYRCKSFEEIRLHRLFHVDFGEIRYLKSHDVINSNSWFLAILRLSRFVFIQANFCFLRIK